MKNFTKTAVIAGLILTGASGAAFAKGKGGLRAADTNNDKEISQEEFTTHFVKRFASFDTNNDGVITKDEATAAAAASDDRKKKRGAGRIRALDADWDGQVTTAEIATASAAMFDRLDTNDDGKLTRADRKGKRGKGKRGGKMKDDS